MGELHITIADVLAVLVILTSAGYATYHGVLRETLWVFAGAASVYAALLFGPLAIRIMGDAIEMPLLRYAVAYGAVFAVVFIPLSILSHNLKQTVQRTPIGPVDRILGFGFGAGRGLLIVCAVYLVFASLVPLREQPAWLTEARLYPLVTSSSDVLNSLIPDQGGATTAELAPVISTRAAPDKKPARAAEDTGNYGAGDRRALDRLIETTGNR
jgi:membrane protein required for colicin V production